MRRLLLVLLCLGPLVAGAAIDLQEFATPAQEARYHALIDELRCPKCLNTNLSGSDSPISADLRRTVARMVREGRSDEEIRGYLLERYGDFILYRPRVTPATWLLWFGPAVLLLVGAGVIVLMVRRQRRAAGAADLSPEEAERLARLRAATDTSRS